MISIQMKKRLLYYEIEPYLTHKNALVIVGMRQVGKTTLMRQLYEKLGEESKVWYDLDNPLERKIFEGDDYRVMAERVMREAGGKSERVVVFLDEVQNLPEVTKFIKYGIDHYKIKFVVTGSSSYYLKNLFPESLSGRKFVFELSPMSFREMLYFREIIELGEARSDKWPEANDEIEAKKRMGYYEEYLKWGGFPEVVETKRVEDKRRILKNIFTSFFEKDLQFLADLSQMRELRDLLLLLVPRVGSLVDVSKIARELSISREKIYQYLELLQGTFVIDLMSKYSKSIDRSVAGGKKIYFGDNGILRTIGEVNRGQLLENAVVNQLKRYGELSYYNRRGESEIDVIVNKKMAVEVKMIGTQHDYVKLGKLADGLAIKNRVVVSGQWREGEGLMAGSLV